MKRLERKTTTTTEKKDKLLKLFQILSHFIKTFTKFPLVFKAKQGNFMIADHMFLTKISLFGKLFAEMKSRDYKDLYR